MKLFTILAASAIVGAMFAGSAYAGDTNTLYLEQIGDGNISSVHQSTGPGLNDIGTAADPVSQTGDNNIFTFSNSGCCNANNRYNNDVTKAEQDGDGNWLNIGVGNLSHDNLVSDAQQMGDTNRLLIVQNGSNFGTVSTVLQDGDVNSAVLKQGGASNTISNVEMVGDNNGYSNTSEMASGRFASLRVVQSGSGNLVTHARIEGDNNKQVPSNGYAPLLDVVQSGNDNGLISSIATMLGSDGNFIHVSQVGNSNNFNLTQGLSTSSTQNFTTVSQNGDGHMATSTQNGSYNLVNIVQSGDNNTVSSLVTGDSNGSGVFSNSGVASLATSNSLVSGDISQDGMDNQVTFTIAGSDGNQFAFLQSGNTNLIGGDITTSLGANQAVGVQDGNDNIASFSQAGGSNVATFNQAGDSNHVTITQ